MAKKDFKGKIDDHVRVTLSEGSKYEGTITEIHEDGYIVLVEGAVKGESPHTRKAPLDADFDVLK